MKTQDAAREYVGVYTSGYMRGAGGVGKEKHRKAENRSRPISGGAYLH